MVCEKRDVKAPRVGVVGVGHIGKNHARLYAELPSAQFTAIYDTNRAVAQQYAAELDRALEVGGDHVAALIVEPVGGATMGASVPPEGYQGVNAVLGTVAGLKKFVSIKESAYHGLNFCQGTVSEMLEKPGEQIYDVIRWFGDRGKIFNVHFRNIRGGYLKFQETYPDDGDVDMLQAMRVYKEVGYDGMMMPDHVPQTAGDERGLQSFAFAFGYIRALIQAVDSEG